MKTSKIVLPVLALLLAAGAIFAKNQKVAPKSAQNYVWIYYDCSSLSNPPLTTPGNYTTDQSEAESQCPEPNSTRICAVQYLEEEVTFSENNVATPLAGATQQSVIRCNQ